MIIITKKRLFMILFYLCSVEPAKENVVKEPMKPKDAKEKAKQLLASGVRSAFYDYLKYFL